MAAPAGSADVWAMLKDCAPGHSAVETDHAWRITWNGRVYPHLPNGGHGRRHSYEVDASKVRKMAATLGIETCAKAHLPQCWQ